MPRSTTAPPTEQPTEQPIRAKSIPAKSIPAKSAPAKSAPAKSAPAKSAPAKSAPSKQSPRRSAGHWARETPIGLTRRARRIDRELAMTYPDARIELDFTSPLELAVATILSAQCTDVRVNLTTPALFRRYPTAAAYAGVDRAELEEMIRPTGFFRNKAGSLIGLGRELLERYDGEVPARLDELVTLPGIGRKTGNVILGNAFGRPGITVDTHLGRLARRWGWTTNTDPVKVEADIAVLIPRRDWTMMSHRAIWHGRRVCHSRTPACGACPIASLCPSYGAGPTDPQVAARLVKSGPAAAASMDE